MSALSSRRRWSESGPRLNERMNEWERERERSEWGEPVWTGNESFRRRDRPNPLTWTHTLTPPRGLRPEEEWQNQELGSEAGVREVALFFFLSFAWDDKEPQLSGPENELQRQLNTWLMATQTGRRNERHASMRKRWLIFTRKKPASGQDLHKTSETHICFWIISWKCTRRCLDGVMWAQRCWGRCTHPWIMWLRRSVVEGVAVILETCADSEQSVCWFVALWQQLLFH